jgi:arylsulfatase A-like enzyme/HEAT repeat protein
MADAADAGKTAAPSRPPLAPRARASRAISWIDAGLWSGVAVGVADTAWAVVRGVGGLDSLKAAKLVMLGSSWLAVAGAVAGALVAIAARLVGPAPGARDWAAPALAALVSAPVLVADAFAMFAGRRAAEIPARHLLSVMIALAGSAAVFVSTRWLCAVAADRARRRRAAIAAGMCGVVAGASEIANRLVLPRLYPWFHASLAALTVAVAMIGFRFGLDLLGAKPDDARRWRRLALRVVAVAALAVLAGVQARRSQTIRFAALERTSVIAQLLRLSPVSLRSRTYVGVERQEAERELPPLPEGPRRPEADVLLITVDALRADHVGAYGYRRHPTTPHIDELAARSVRFTRAYAQAPHTSFSVASMLTGKYFPTLARLAPAEVHDPIASVLRGYAWRTAAFYPPAVFFVDAQKLKAYADSNFAFEYVKFEYLEAPKRTDQVIRYYDVEKPKKSFVWVHFFEPHEPYVAHPEFPFGAADVDRYDSEIATADAAIGRLLAYVRARRPGTIVILAADHGEEFDEHGGRYHGSSLFDEQIHVPLLIAIPGVTPRVVDRPVELIDITPTVLNLLDVPVPARMRGTDLGPWLATPPADPARLPPAFAEVEDKRMIVVGEEKLICDLNWGFCAYHDLGADPGEKKNLADERPERTAALRRMLDEWLDGHVRLEPVLARGAANPNGESVPRAIERGRLGDLLAGTGLAALMLSTDESAAVRQEAAQLLVSLPPRKETAGSLLIAMDDRDPLVAAWAAVGAVRVGDSRAVERVAASLDDPKLPRALRVRGALALALRGNKRGVPTLAESLDACQDDVLLCRLAIIQLGQLKDRRAVPALLTHSSEVQNRREMIDALGDIGDPIAIPTLLERLRHDEYVPVRAQAARALAKIGRVDVLPALEQVLRDDTEASVVAAAREAIAMLRAGRPG